MKRVQIAISTAVMLLSSMVAFQSTAAIPSGISWYGVLSDGLQEAERTGKPIFLLSAAPQCAGVPGMW